MVDPDTFLTTLYVMADDFDKSSLGPETAPGPDASLSRSEVITLALFSQWSHFPSERGFYRWAATHLRDAFPRLPVRSQFNRLLRRYQSAVIAFGLFLAHRLTTPADVYEALDGLGAATRNAQRRGAGWLAGEANIGYSNRLGWYEGLHLLTAVTRTGVITGYGLAPASTKEQPYAETFLAARACPAPQLPEVGQAVRGWYLTDNGFVGAALHRHWEQDYAAWVISPPQRSSRHPWPKAWRRWLAHFRQIVETVHDKLLNLFRLDRERPHDLQGFRTRWAAKVGLHNFCIWFNRLYGRADLAFADLIDW